MKIVIYGVLCVASFIFSPWICFYGVRLIRLLRCNPFRYWDWCMRKQREIEQRDSK